MVYAATSKDKPGIAPLSNFGAEVTGVDLGAPIDDWIAHELREALIEYQILIFRGAAISPESQLRLTHYFGEPEPGVTRRPANHQVPGHPDILKVSNEADSPTRGYGFIWHSDGQDYARTPHGATMLHCVSCPKQGGDTLFANQYHACDAMPPDIRAQLQELYWHLPRVPHSEIPDGRGLVHPFIRTHEQTGRDFIFCSPRAVQIRGMTRDDSSEILRVVHEYQLRDDVLYRHSWRKNDVVVWENCALLHARADFVDFELQGLRMMHRTATAGRVSAIECEAPEE